MVRRGRPMPFRACVASLRASRLGHREHPGTEGSSSTAPVAVVRTHRGASSTLQPPRERRASVAPQRCTEGDHCGLRRSGGGRTAFRIGSIRVPSALERAREPHELRARASCLPVPLGREWRSSWKTTAAVPWGSSVSGPGLADRPPVGASGPGFGARWVATAPASPHCCAAWWGDSPRPPVRCGTRDAGAREDLQVAEDVLATCGHEFGFTFTEGSPGVSLRCGRLPCLELAGGPHGEAEHVDRTRSCNAMRADRVARRRESTAHSSPEPGGRVMGVFDDT